MSEPASILIVDDDAGMSRSLSMILRHKGYDAATAEGGVEAIEKVKEKHYDFVLMDVKMPEMDGVEAQRGIRKIRPESTVIMMTAFSVDEMVQQALREGARHVMFKPFDADNLVGLLRTIIS